MSKSRSILASALACVLLGTMVGGVVLYFVLHRPAPLPKQIRTGTAPAQTTTATASVSARLIFSANFVSGGDCRDHYVKGCDLFTADVNLDTGESSNISPLVTSEDVGETFPRLPASAENVLTFNRSTANGNDKGTGETAMLYAFDSKRVTTLMERATMPFPSPDGLSAYVRSLKDNTLFVSPVSPLAFQPVEGIENVHEPHVAPNGNIVFFQSSPDEKGTNKAQGMLYVAAKKKTVPLTEANGSAHCFWNADGSAAYCNNAINGGIFRYDVSSAGAVSPGVLAIPTPSARELSQLDPAFSPSVCKVIDVAYGTFCDANHLALMAGCYSSGSGKKTGESNQVLSETMIYNLTTKTFLPIGKMLAQTYAGAGTSTYTATCRVE